MDIGDRQTLKALEIFVYHAKRFLALAARSCRSGESTLVVPVYAGEQNELAGTVRRSPAGFPIKNDFCSAPKVSVSRLKTSS